jgi:hypothetical protein
MSDEPLDSLRPPEHLKLYRAAPVLLIHIKG